MFHNLSDVAAAVAKRISDMSPCPFKKVSASPAADANALLEHVKAMAAWPAATVCVGPGSFEHNGLQRVYTIAIVASAEFAAHDASRASALLDAVDALSAEFLADTDGSVELLTDLSGVVRLEPKGWAPAGRADRVSAFALEIEVTEIQFIPDPEEPEDPGPSEPPGPPGAPGP